MRQTISKNFLFFFLLASAFLVIAVFSFAPRRFYSPGITSAPVDKKVAILQAVSQGRELTEEERRMVSEYLGENPPVIWSEFSVEEKSAVISALNKK